MQPILTVQALTKLWPHAPKDLIQGMADSSPIVFKKYGIADEEDRDELMATCSEETGGGIKLTESGAYSAARAHIVWEKLFPSVESAIPYVKDAKTLFNHTYSGILGNRPGTDDGYDFRGRGLIEVTGRLWYEKIGRATGLNLIENPDLLSSPPHALECACAFWNMDDVNAIASAGEFLQVTKKANGGYTNLALREGWLKLCHTILNEPSNETATILTGRVPPLPSYVTPKVLINKPLRPVPAQAIEDVKLGIANLPAASKNHPTFWMEIEAFIARWSNKSVGG